KELGEEGEPGENHNGMEDTVGALSIAVGAVMKPDADAHRTSFRSEDAKTTASLTDPREPARVFNRHRLIEIQQTAVDVREWMHLRTVCEIELQAERCDSRAIRSLATKRIYAGRTRRSRNDHSGGDRDRYYIDPGLQH